MRLKLILLLLSLFSLNFVVRAQNPQPTPKSNPTQKAAKTEPNYTAKDYENLLAKLKAGDIKIDFTVLRMAFVKTREYSYSGTDKTEREKFLKPFSDKNYQAALKQSENFLEKSYLDATAHFVAYSSAKELKDDKKADFYKAVLVGLLSSIKNGNDGFSAEKPFSVITIDEEYTLMKFLGYQFSSQSLQSINGHKFDVFTATNAKTSEKVKLYFNIDVIWKAESEIFTK